MPRKAGHNQPNFIHGIRDTGPNPDNYFTSAQRLENYNVTSAGHLKRRASLETLITINKTVLGNVREIKQIIPFNNTYIFLLNDGSIKIDATLESLECVPYAIKRYNTAPPYAAEGLDQLADPTKSEAFAAPGEAVTINKIIAVGDFIWAIPDNHFAPFIIEVTENGIEIFPLYLLHKNVNDVYPLLRTIPLNPSGDLVLENPAALSALELQKYVRLYIDKDTDLNAGICDAWIGLDLPSTITPATISGDINLDVVSLKKFLFKPLFFNVLPTKAFKLNSDPTHYDTANNYTGNFLGLQTLTGVAGFEVAAKDRVRLIKELLFGRKFCIIPTKIQRIPPDVMTDKSYDNVYETTAQAISAITEASFNFKHLADNRNFNAPVPSGAYLTLDTQELQGDYQKTERKLSGSLSYRGFSFANDALRLSFGYSSRTGRARVRITLDLGDIGGRLQSSNNSNPGVSASPALDGSVRYDFLKLYKTGLDRDDRNDIRDDIRRDLARIDNFKELHEYVNDTYNDRRNPAVALETRVNPRFNFNTGAWNRDNAPDTVEFAGQTYSVSSFDSGVLFIDDRTFDTYSFSNSEVLPVVFKRGGSTVYPSLGDSESGTRRYGWTAADPRSELKLHYRSIDGQNKTINAEALFKENTLFKKIQALEFTKNFSNNTYEFVIDATGDIRSDLSGLGSVSLGGTQVSLGSRSVEGHTYTYRLSNANLYNKAARTGVDQRIIFNSLTPEYNEISESLPPLAGFNRAASLKYNNGTGELVAISKRSDVTDVTPQLRDNQGLLAVGLQLFKHDDQLKYTPFVFVRKTARLASATYVDVTFNNGTPHRLPKVDETSEVHQAFRLPNSGLLSNPRNLEGRFTVSLLFNIAPSPQTNPPSTATPYEFVNARAAEIRSKVRTQCLIFELGMPASVVKTGSDHAGKRYIGGNNYDDNHAIVGRVLEGISSGFDTGAAVGAFELYASKNSKLYRFSRDEEIYSNNIIRRLNSPISQEAKDAYAMSNIVLRNLITDFQPDETTNTEEFTNELEIVLNFLEHKNIQINTKAEYRAVEAYFSGGYLAAGVSARLYNAELLDLTGDTLNLITTNSNFNSTGIYLGTDKGVFDFRFLPDRNGEDQPITLLLSRQRVLSNFISLNNKLVFINTERILTALTFSDERQGYREQKFGVYQQDFLVKPKDNDLFNLVFNPLEDAFYCLTNQDPFNPDTDDPEDYRYTFSILRAINIDENIGGWSSYAFRRPADRRVVGGEAPYAKPKLLFTSEALYTLIEKDEELVLARFTKEEQRDENGQIVKPWTTEDFISTPEDAQDGPDAFKYLWQSAFASNRLIFNNLAGMDGATTLIGVDKVAMFVNEMEFPEASPETLLGALTYSDVSVVYPFPVQVSFTNPLTRAVETIIKHELPVHDIENVLDYRTSLLFIDKRQDMQGTVFGFQATTSQEIPSH